MSLTADQFIATQKSSLDMFFGFSAKAFEGMEKLVELNMQVARANLAETAETSQAMLGAKDMQELLTLQAGMVQPAAEKVAAYGRHVYDIMAGTNAEVTKAAEATVAEGQRKVLALVDTAVKNAPAGTEGAVAMVRSAVAAANNAFESANKAAKQATEVAEANFTAMTNQAVKASGATKARRAA